MALSCPNCSNNVLATDSICWHCGWRLSPLQKQEQARPAAAHDSEPVTGSDGELAPLASIVAYGVLTLAILVGVVWLTDALSSRPLLTRHPQSLLDTSLVVAADRRLTVSLDLPSGWSFVTPEDDGQTPNSTDNLLAQANKISQVIQPASSQDAEARVLLAAWPINSRGADDGPKLFVTELALAAGGKASEIAGRLSQDRLAVVDANTERNFVDQEQARIELRLSEPELDCIAYYVPASQWGGGHVYTAAACARSGQFTPIRQDLLAILNTFQVLPGPATGLN